MNRLDFFKKIGKGAAVVVAAPVVWALPKSKAGITFVNPSFRHQVTEEVMRDAILVPNSIIVSVTPGVQKYINSVERANFNPSWQIVLIHRRGDHPNDPKDRGQYCPNSGGWI